jgi:hypothetical protein
MTASECASDQTHLDMVLMAWKKQSLSTPLSMACQTPMDTREMDGGSHVPIVAASAIHHTAVQSPTWAVVPLC